jgi:hypothetical protein
LNKRLVGLSACCCKNFIDTDVSGVDLLVLPSYAALLAVSRPLVPIFQFVYLGLCWEYADDSS